MKKTILFSLLLFIAIVSFSQNLTMYVESGGQGIKFGILDFDNNFRKFKVVDSKEINIGLSGGIQEDGNIKPKDINNAVSGIYDTYTQLLELYKPQGLTEENVYFYTSSGLGVAKNISVLTSAIQSKVNHGVYVVKEVEEAKYTIAGTIPYDKIDNGFVLDQGGSNTKGGYVIKNISYPNGKIKITLSAQPIVFDLGSKRVEMLVRQYMTKHPDDKQEEINEFITAMNKCFDSLKVPIKETFGNVDGVELRDELYLSGGAAFAITTLIKPESDLKTQMTSITLKDLKSFLADIEDKDTYNKIKGKTFTDEKIQANYIKALKIYNQIQLLSLIHI